MLPALLLLAIAVLGETSSGSELVKPDVLQACLQVQDSTETFDLFPDARQTARAASADTKLELFTTIEWALGIKRLGDTCVPADIVISYRQIYGVSSFPKYYNAVQTHPEVVSLSVTVSRNGADLATIVKTCPVYRRASDKSALHITLTDLEQLHFAYLLARTNLLLDIAEQLRRLPASR